MPWDIIPDYDTMESELCDLHGIVTEANDEREDGIPGYCAGEKRD
jgi:hypothetical protein